MTPKRPIPTKDVCDWREGYMSALRYVMPMACHGSIPDGLSPGNRKTGQSGSVHATVFTWSLPAVVTCPGLSRWCERHCYNADRRTSVFPVESWARNWWWVLNDPDTLRGRICAQLTASQPHVGVRLHSSGDFFAPQYIAFWDNIARTFPDVRFWTYTRSWAVPDLLPCLEDLRLRPNVSLFASWDASMPAPPAGWPQSLVLDSLEQVKKYEVRSTAAFVCPEQIGKASCCADCGFCSHRKAQDILFYLH